MSIPAKATRNMRIIAVPLTRPIQRQPTQIPNARRILTYYQFQITHDKPPPSSSPKGPVSRWMPEGGLANWISNKATSTWASFGKAEGGWKLKVFQTGERLVDRMEFEELALKSIDPSLGPRVIKDNAKTSIEDEKIHQEKIQIPLIYPPSIHSGPAALDELRSLTASRIPGHRKGFFLWMFIAPFTAPFMIIPIIPNLPFFFCAWRSWSHYKAYRASEYLQTLIDAGYIVPEAHKPLDLIYKDCAPRIAHDAAESKKDNNSPPPQHEVLLTHDAVPRILSLFDLGSSPAADVLRAVEQARIRVESGKQDL